MILDLDLPKITGLILYRGVEDQIPRVTDSGDQILAAFASKGLSKTDLTALVGSHTCANQFVTDPSKVGASLDSTPGTWDVTYYQQVLNTSAPFVLQSDTSISKNTQTAPIFKSFAGSFGAWSAAFIPA
jgi:hypothetical protein